MKKSLQLTEEESPLKKKVKMDKNETLGGCVSETLEKTFAIHPLLIDHVVEKVFHHMVKKSSSEDLLRCRLVCKSWCTTGTEMFQRLEANREVRFSFGDTHRMKGFLAAMKNTTSLPFQNYRFDVNFFIEENRELFPEFMNTCSPFIRNLSLCFGKNFKMFFDPDKFENVDMGRLKSLSFKCTYLNTMTSVGSRNMWHSEQPPLKQYEGLLKLLKVILETAPDLEELDFSILTGHLSREDNRKFGDLLAKSLPAKVTNLKLIFEIEEEQLKKLQTRDLKLQMLHISFYGSLLENECIQTFLDSQKKTLKSLNIADLEKQFAEELDYPTLNSLKVLEINGGNYSSFSYLKAFPTLEKLILRNGRNGDPDSVAVVENPELYFPSVKDVELTYEANICRLVRRFAQIFPSLQKFRLKVGADSLSALQTVFEVMPCLVELHIVFPHFFGNLAVDTILTGIPIEDCRDMLEKQSFEESDISAISRKPNISNLSKLKKLSIKAESYAIVVTNVTAIFGLLQNPSLEELEMDKFNISGDCFRRLKNRFRIQEDPTKKEHIILCDAKPFIPRIQLERI